MQHQQEKAAFTLIELSIVLVIIGLIVGGVLVGQSLIYSAQINSVISDVTKYKIALNSFKAKYGYIAGDIPNAYEIFGSECGSDSLAPSGCNGNNDGRIDNNINNPIERFRLWQHLSLAGMINQQMSGVIASGPGSQAGVNIPSLKLEGAGITASFWTSSPSNSFWIGANNPSYDLPWIAHNPVLTPMEAFNIDKKIDDGIFSSGQIQAIDGYGGYGAYPCINSDYNFAETRKTCVIFFTKQY